MIPVNDKPVTVFDLFPEDAFKDLLAGKFSVRNISTCGFKLRYEVDHGIKQIFDAKARERMKSGTDLQARVSAELPPDYRQDFKIEGVYNKVKIIGKADFYSIKRKHIIELKYTESKQSYLDIDTRQLQTYMILARKNVGIDFSGSLWIFHGDTQQWEIHEISYNETNLSKQTDAFVKNKYIYGIQSSACNWCKNIECSINPARTVVGLDK